MASSRQIFPLIPRRRATSLAFGSMRSVRRGAGSDLANFRPYQPGDDRRRIDWKLSARQSSMRGHSEFIVRERYAEEATRVVIVADRRPAMEAFPIDSPWLHKPTVIVEAGRMIADSAVAGHSLVGYLDYADMLRHGPTERIEAFWRPPNSQRKVSRVKTRNLPHPHFYAPEDNLTIAFRDLLRFRSEVPAESMVFVISDFLVMPEIGEWQMLTRRCDVIAVIVQDPVWEQTFPDVAGLTLRLVDPAAGRERLVRFTKRDVERRRQENEERFRQILTTLNNLGVDQIVLSTCDADAIYGAFRAWAHHRQFGRR